MTKQHSGIRYWMERVLDEMDKGFVPDAVHDLRVALRRCRSLAGGLMLIDRDKAWKIMKKEGRRLFKRLGGLRDVHVLSEWTLRIGGPDDPVSIAMLTYLNQRELELRDEAAESIKSFNQGKWRSWIESLQERTHRLPLGGAVFQLFALQCWNEAHELHKQAMHNRSSQSYHRLRIGLKKFRYTVENFLPHLHSQLEDDLKILQDWLGELHDLSVLWETLNRIRAFPDANCRERWRFMIDLEREKRIEQYRSKMTGDDSPWDVWRAGLPVSRQLRALSLKAIEKWGAFHGIDLGHACAVRRLALQLFDGLYSKKSLEPDELKTRRAIVHASAILYEAGRSRNKETRKAVRRLMQQSSLLQGFTSESLRLVTIIITCQRGKFYAVKDPEFANLLENRRQTLLELAGILRLARVLAGERECLIQSLKARRLRDSIVIFAEGYSEPCQLAEKAAKARYTLEYALKVPVLIRSKS